MQVLVIFIDTFTTEKFKGNPTAVCVVDNPLNSDLMLSIAKEFNLPVTAFIEKNSSGLHPIKYFTITGEIPACGHATLASARVMFEMGKNDTVKFQTKEKIVITAIQRDDTIYMTYPKYDIVTVDVSKDVLKSLGLNEYASAGICTELEALFIELNDAHVLRTVSPNYKNLVQSNREITEVVITSASDKPAYDFLLRSFCPWIGIDEDPVTGSVHSVLAGFWKDRLGKNDLKAYQASERGGEAFVRAFDDKVELGGKTVILFKSELSI